MLFSPQDILAIESELMRRSFRDFVQAAYPIFNASPIVIESPQIALIAIVQAIGDGSFGESYDVLINVPPGSGKTSIMTCLQAWLWARTPSMSYVVASHTQAFCLKKASDFKQLVTSKWYQSHFDVKIDTEALHHIQNSKHGVRDATSVGGSVTGTHFSLQIIDDLVDCANADSASMIQEANAWCSTTLSSRWQPGQLPKRIFVNQRIATTDITNAVLLNPRGKIFHLTLPAIMPETKAPTQTLRTLDGNTIFDDQRQAGQLLSPKLFRQEFIDGARREMGSVKFQAQYQQSPVKVGTGITDPAWLNHTYDIAPTFDKIVMVADTAITGHNDPIALLVAGILGSKAYLLECVNDRYTQLETIGQIEELESRYHINEIVIEKAASGVGVAEILAQTRSNVVFISHGGKSKLERYKNSTIALESGSVLFPQTGFEGFKELILAFPNKTIPDECVDVLAYLIHRYLLKPPDDQKAIADAMEALFD